MPVFDRLSQQRGVHGLFQSAFRRLLPQGHVRAQALKNKR
jgi:hypothetical protein